MIAKHSVLARVLRPEEGGMPTDFARKLLTLGFDVADQRRYEELSTRAQEGALSPGEQAELDDLLIANDVLAILHAKAKVSLASSAA